MPIVAHLRTAVETLFTDSLAAIPATTRQRLTNLVLGVLWSDTLVLRQVAITLTRLEHRV